MMSVMSAQSTARKVPEAMPMRTTPSDQDLGRRREARHGQPDRPDRAGDVDQRLAPDPVREQPATGSSRSPSSRRRDPDDRDPQAGARRRDQRASASGSSRLKPRNTFTPARNSSRLSTRKTKLRSRRMSVPHAERAIASHERPSRASRPCPRGRTGTCPIAVASSTTPRNDERDQGELPEAEREGDQHGARDEADGLHGPDEGAREPDLLRRHEVGHVALERALGEVRAELQQDQEDHQGRSTVCDVAEADQEDDVEDRRR